MTVLDASQLGELLSNVELPTPSEEIWRYSRIDRLDLTAFTLVDHVPDVSGPAEFITMGADVDLFPDDRPDVFAELAAQAAPAVHISVPAGTTVPEPIVINHRVRSDGSMSCARVAIDVGADADVTVIERFVSDGGDGESMIIPVLQIRAAQAARVKYMGVNQLDERAWSIGHQQATGARDSSTLLATVALGGWYARVRTEAKLIGQGGSTRQVALYLAGDEQMHDFRTIQDHIAPNTSSDLLFKGAVQDHSRSVYTGLIKIGEEADGTAAYQTNRNLTLSEGAWVESVPNLDIRTNDVKCSHASTVGPIDEDQRFYLESRGVRPEVAERLVVLGFFDEVLDRLPGGELNAELRAAVADKLHIGPSAVAPNVETAST